jgi:23S rRNA pseudouridine2605 synthase
MTTKPEIQLPDDDRNPVAEPAEPRPVRRRRTVKAAAGETETDSQTCTVAALTQVDASVEPTRTPRRRRAAAPVAELEPGSPSADAEPVPAAATKGFTVEPTGHAEPAPQRIDATKVQLESSTVEAGGAAAVEPEAADRSADRSRRRNRRERQRASRAQDEATGGEPGARRTEPMPVQARSPEQVLDLFTQLMSGAFDAEEQAAQAGLPIDAERDGETVTDGADVAAVPKRVLAPDPDAPKLQKVLGQAGVGSRRDMEELILDGRITVNGEPAHIGQRISFGDRIEVNGRAIKYRIAPPRPRVIAYHKPVGEVVTRDDPQQRPTVFRRLPPLQNGKWQSVGRLDINTEGLLLFTNSGELANQLMHPRFGVEREYAVRVLGTLDKEARERLLQGVMVEGQTAGFKAIEDGGGEGANHWYRVVITEGRNREVRKLFDTVGLTVSRLIRIRYGTVVLPRGLKRGVWTDLEEADVRLIRQLAGGPRARDDSPAQAGGGRGPQGETGERGPRPNDRGGRGDRGERGPRRELPPPRTQGPEPDAREIRDSDADEDLDFDPSRIPNPLEQTFDRRFAQNTRSPFGRGGGGGFGPGGSAPVPAPKRGSGPREPDPLQTSVGYIGADAFHRKGGRGGPRGDPGAGGSGGGGFGGNRGGSRGGNRGGNRGGGTGGGGGGRGGQRSR